MANFILYLVPPWTLDTSLLKQSSPLKRYADIKRGSLYFTRFSIVGSA
ncbi:hypothetical protein CCACVL1_03833 [Corchorus capsularis]|uniref:Uncharacterized protein n=1 Tax=Corchorus capsularis TaxID=210143 RepID=A0A1R3JWZ6_COCAP|nr:hypothetical protein CCACVL1_03833 [Corchorus capsularis]